MILVHEAPLAGPTLAWSESTGHGEMILVHEAPLAGPTLAGLAF